MSEKEGRKEFIEPELTKCEESLDEVTADTHTSCLGSPIPDWCV